MVRGWPPLTMVRKVRSFLGFVGYYRRFTMKAAVLHGLLKGVRVSSKIKIEWIEEHEEAFQALKRALLEAPVLAYADYTLPNWSGPALTFSLDGQTLLFNGAVL